MKIVQENLRQFLHKVRILWRKQIFVYIDEEFAINRIQPKFLSLLLTGKFRRCDRKGSSQKNIHNW